MNSNNPYRYKWWALIGLGLLSFTAFLDLTIVTTALPFIQKALSASIIQLQWILTIFGMILSMFMIAVGRFADIFGRRKVFYIGFIFFGIAAIGAGLSPTIQWLIFFRAVQGGAAAIIFTVGVALLPQAFPAAEQTKAIGIFSAFNGVGLAAGPFLGGLLITYLDWRWVFWINIPIIIVGILCAGFSLQPSPKPKEKISIDWLGFALLAIGLGCLVYGIIHGEQVAWLATGTWLNLLIGIVALIILFFVEKRMLNPLLDLKIFSNRHAALAMLICIAAGLITSVLLFFNPLYLHIIRGQSALAVGIILLIVPLVQVVISIFLDKLIKRFGVFNLIIFGLFTGFVTAICQSLFAIAPPTLSDSTNCIIALIEPALAIPQV